jgi:predicted O-methyltransferase YrrM
LRAFWIKPYDHTVNFDDAAQMVADIPGPHIPARRAKLLYEHIRKYRPESLLELGTARGGSAVFMASALDENGAGHLTSVDSTRWQWLNPTPSEVLDKAGLSKYVTLDKNYSTYAWFLERELESAMNGAGQVRPKYDFIFLDGAKNWSTDGITVIVAERLLRPGGWLLLDDLGWTYEKHCANKTRHYEIDLTKLSDSERTEPHLRAIFDLLIRTNPAFDEFVVQDDWWGWAHKSAEPGSRANGSAQAARPRNGGVTGLVRRTRRARAS